MKPGVEKGGQPPEIEVGTCAHGPCGLGKPHDTRRLGFLTYGMRIVIKAAQQRLFED